MLAIPQLYLPPFDQHHQYSFAFTRVFPLFSIVYDTIKRDPEYCTATLLLSILVKSYALAMPSIYARQPAFIAILSCRRLLVFEKRERFTLSLKLQISRGRFA